MQNSHSDVQQSSYMCINNEENHIAFPSIKGISTVVTEFGHLGNSECWEKSLRALQAPTAGTEGHHSWEMERVSMISSHTLQPAAMKAAELPLWEHMGFLFLAPLC